MPIKLRDYPVRFRREEDIADIAIKWRRAHGSDGAPYFNIVFFVKTILCPFLERRNEKLYFDFFDAADGEDLAYVTVEPLTLHIDREIWDLAEKGDPFPRLVVAHEVGHIVLHGHYPRAAFSNDPSVQLKAIPQGRSAEWQAIVFADHFLLPTRTVSAFETPFEIVKACSVQLELAEKRFTDVRENRLKKLYGAVICQTCGQFSCTEQH